MPPNEIILNIEHYEQLSDTEQVAAIMELTKYNEHIYNFEFKRVDDGLDEPILPEWKMKDLRFHPWFKEIMDFNVNWV